uniref:Ig-like domain-containing protein n=1 Tax=Coturnix japonica TaxID=93934 RepID=A0A8C2Y5C9_COTJA
VTSIGPTLYPLLPPPSECNDINVTIGCLVTSFIPPPVTISWTITGSSLAPSSAMTSLPVQTSGGTYSQTTALVVPMEEVKGGQFTCRAQHPATKTDVTETIEDGELVLQGG